MSEQLPVLEATGREKTGKEYNKKARAKGLIPANLVGKGQSTSIEVDKREFARAYKQSKEMILNVSGGQKRVKVIELQVNRLKQEPLHVDFLALA